MWNKNLENVNEDDMRAFGSLLLELEVAKDAISSLRSRYGLIFWGLKIPYNSKLKGSLKFYILSYDTKGG